MALPIGSATHNGISLPATHHHIERLVDQLIDHYNDRASIVGRVSIDHDIDVSVDIRSHPSNNIALAGKRHAEHYRPLTDGDFFRAIC